MGKGRVVAGGLAKLAGRGRGPREGQGTHPSQDTSWLLAELSRECGPSKGAIVFLKLHGRYECVATTYAPGNRWNCGVFSSQGFSVWAVLELTL